MLLYFMFCSRFVALVIHADRCIIDETFIPSYNGATRLSYIKDRVAPGHRWLVANHSTTGVFTELRIIITLFMLCLCFRFVLLRIYDSFWEATVMQDNYEHICSNSFTLMNCANTFENIRIMCELEVFLCKNILIARKFCVIF